MADKQFRARARARGRATGAPPTGPPPQLPPQQRPAPAQQAPPPEAPMGRATLRPSAPRAGPSRGGPPVEAMSRLEIGGRGQAIEGAASGAAAPGPGRGALRGRREIGPAFIVTKPPNLVSKEGGVGDPIQLTTNYFQLKTATDWCLYQYRVDFEPEEDIITTRKRLLRVHAEKFGGYLFDGSVMFTSCVLHPDPMEVFSERESDQVKIKIIIKKVGNLVLGDSGYLQVYNIFMRFCLQGLDLQLVGRDYFDHRAKIVLRDHNIELWPGYITSIRQHENSLLMMSDVTHKVMRQTTALDLLHECSQRNKSDWKELFVNSIVGTVVLTDYNNRTYRVDDVDFSRNPSATFDMKGTQISLKDYYRQRYGITLQDDRQPVLVSRPSARDRRAGRTEPIVLIPEVCRLTGITDEMRSDFKAMSAIAEHTRINPGVRQTKLYNFIKRVSQNQKTRDELSLWNITLSDRMVQLTGRQLPNEKILHGGGASNMADPRSADWTQKLLKNSFIMESKLMNWAVICFSRGMRDLQGFLGVMQRANSSYHFRIPDPTIVEIPDDRGGSYVQAIEKLVAERNPDLIMCVVPNNRSDRYAAIKKKACVDRPVPTQVVLSKNVNKKVMAVASKIGIQISCKIGGAPWSVEIPLKDTMIVGYDATRDTQSKDRSFGAMVASLNKHASQYFSSVACHTVGEELSDHISLQLIQACLKFRDYQKCLPEKIIFYRDGVGEGQLPHVFNHEIKAIENKLKDIYQSKPPQMTYIVVTKKINTKFFHGEQNPPPGTVVDNTVTCPEFYDFFLVSQSVRQGTVTPTMYNVIYDTINLQPGRLQRLTYKMCHLYYNWSGTIRVPAQCQYAHKLAFLVGQALHRQPSAQLCDKLYFL